MIEKLAQSWNNEGYTTLDERKVILECLDQLKTDLPVVEIGVWEGRTTTMMAEFLKRKDKKNKIIGIDTFTQYGNKLAPIYAETEQKIAGYDIELIQGFSDEVAQDMGDISLLFIDGNHDYDYVLKDIQLYLPKVKEFCLLHDSHYEDVDKAIKECGLKVDRLVDSISVIKK